jgi:hypothetical protein
MKKETKKPEMTVTKNEEAKNEKLTYEQLEQVANNLNNQCRNLHQRCLQAENALASFNEVALLLDVLEKDSFFSDAFVERCSATIEKIISSALDATEKSSEEEK